MKTDKYRKLLSCRTSLLYAADKAANENNDVLAQVTAYVTAPVLFCYVRYILDSVKKQGIKKIYFLSRDGYILKQMADIIIKSESLPVTTYYLYVSRYSLRNALYYKCDGAEDFERAGLFTGYTLKSAKNILKRVGFDLGQRSEVYGRIDFNGNENKNLTDNEYDLFCEKLKKDGIFLSEVKKRSEENYKNITEYFRQNNLFDGERFAVADSGWVGTVQKTLTELIKDKTGENCIVGYYFGLYRREDENYRAFLFDVTDAYKYVPTFCNNLFECFCSAPHGMTVGYEQKNGTAIPVLSPANEKMLEMANVQISVAKRFTRYACEKYEYIPISLMRKLSAGLLKELMYKPDRQEAAVLGAFPFSDDVTEAKMQSLAGDCKGSIANILLLNRILRKKKGKNIYPDKYYCWLYGSIVLSNRKPLWVYRLSVREWERLRLIREKRKVCR